ncbi:hypothetical protein Ancab_016220 [Ancistrocladus abbreviatus]
MVALTNHSLPSATTFVCTIRHRSRTAADGKPGLYGVGRFFTTQRLKLFLLFPSPYLSPAPCALPSSVFLPYFDDNEEEQEGEEEDGEKQNECPQDPIYRFFKSRNSTKDSVGESKLSLQRNRRTSWHLAAEDAEFGEEGLAPDVELQLEEEEQQEEGELVSEIQPVVREILEIARHLPDNSSLGEQLGPYEKGGIGERECVELLELMFQEGLTTCCLYFYEWMGLQDPPLVTPRTCSTIFPALGNAGMSDKVIILWRNLPQGRQFRDVRVYNAAISGLLSGGRYNDAWEVYEEMEFNNILPDHVTCSIMITVMRKEGKSAKEAWEFFERMNRRGANWSLEVIGALIKSFCDEGLHKQALIIQAEMEGKGISSNIIIYNTLMDAYCKSNQLEEAEALFAEIRAKGLSPSSATYNILMDAYSKRMQPEIVEKLLDEMQGIGLEPNVKSYTCLISAYGRQKKRSDMAADAFLRMKKLGIKPNSHSYTALVHAHSVSGWHEKAYTAFENMKREGIRPSVETYTALLDAFRRAGDTQLLMTIWKSMMMEKIEGTRVTFNILVDGFAKQGKYMEARDVMCEFGKIGFEPTVMTYNMLMNAYARGGQHAKLPQLLKEMATLSLKPDSITYSTMIYAYVRVCDFKRAFFYHKQMVKSGQVPDVKSYQKLRAILDVKAATKSKKDRRAILGIINSKMGMLKAKKKGKKDEFWKNKNKRLKSPGSAKVGQL